MLENPRLSRRHELLSSFELQAPTPLSALLLNEKSQLHTPRLDVSDSVNALHCSARRDKVKADLAASSLLRESLTKGHDLQNRGLATPDVKRARVVATTQPLVNIQLLSARQDSRSLTRTLLQPSTAYNGPLLSARLDSPSLVRTLLQPSSTFHPKPKLAGHNLRGKGGLVGPISNHQLLSCYTTSSLLPGYTAARISLPPTRAFTEGDVIQPPKDEPEGKPEEQPMVQEHTDDSNSTSAPHYNLSHLEDDQSNDDRVETITEETLKSTPVQPDVILKKQFVNAISASLLSAPKFRSPQDETRLMLVDICDKVAKIDPEFVLKVAIYTRLELNIRTTANFLLAYAGWNAMCRPFLRKYFRKVVMLPSDWIEVADVYQAFQDSKLHYGALPSALRKVLAQKFPEFDKFQLAKYNKEKKKGEPNKKEVKESGAWGNKNKRFPKPPASAMKVMPDSDSDSGDEEKLELKTFTLKQMIRQLHIAEPVEHVMCLIGKKYPETQEGFSRSKLPGNFDESLAGKRMKLPTPETWETQISMKGNKAQVWQDLIDHKKLPFMAMLRNIRNMLRSGVSEKHHQWVLRKLTDEKAVSQSKQFPFRFFSAFQVLNDLEQEYRNHESNIISMAEELKGIEQKKHAGVRLRPSQAKATQIKARIMRKKIKQDMKYDLQLVERYRKALNTSVEIATNFNVPPISGRTLVISNVGSSMNRPCTTARGLGKPRQVSEVAVLLGLMCKHACEACDFVLCMDTHYKVVDIDNTGILRNVESLLSYAAAYNKGGESKARIPPQLLRDILVDRKQFDNMIILSDGMRLDSEDGHMMSSFLQKYRMVVNPDILFVNVDLSSQRSGVEKGMTSQHENDVYLAGFSDQILRFIAERGENGQLTHIENIDVKYDLVERNATPPKASEGVEVLASPYITTIQWRIARVFISSTFLDMHGERDILVRYVFPEIREWAKKRLVNVMEVDLRWGVSEEVSTSKQSAVLCLTEVMNCDYFVGILGDRCGWRPSKDSFPADARFDWLHDSNQSITSLEMLQAIAHKGANKCFFFIRDHSFIKNIPPAYKKLFKSEDVDAELIVNTVKDTVRRSGCEVYDGYPCTWGGVVDGKPITAGLEQFALRVMRNMKEAIARDYPEQDIYKDEVKVMCTQQDAIAEKHCQEFAGRQSQLKALHTHLQSVRRGVLVLTGELGVGKTALLAKFTDDLYHTLTDGRSYVFRHFVTSEFADGPQAMLKRLCWSLSEHCGCPLTSVPSEYKSLVAKIEDLLKMLSQVVEIGVIVIDGVNLLETANKVDQLSWLPETIPENVVFVVGCTTNSAAHRLLLLRNDTTVIELKALDLLDKNVLVKAKLARHGKSLNESAFNNQLKMLTSKKSATNPLYLMLACEELRMFGVYEKMMEKIRSLPPTLPKLLDHILSTIDLELGKPFVSVAMRLLCLFPQGAHTDDFRALLSLASHLPSERLRVEDVIRGDLNSELEGKLIPPIVLAQLLHRIAVFLDEYHSSGILKLTHSSMKEAIRRCYIKSAEDESYCHLLIAGYYYNCIHEKKLAGDQMQHYYRDIIHHLKLAGCLNITVDLLSDLSFLHNKCSAGLVTSLNDDFSSFTSKLPSMEKAWQKCKLDFAPYAALVYKNTQLLKQYPKSLLQLALNEPTESDLWKDAKRNLSYLGLPYVDWVTKPSAVTPCLSTVTLPTVVTCCAFSPDGLMVAFGGADCQIRLYQLSSCKEVGTFVGHSNTISDVKFVTGDRLVSASQDNTISLWDFKSGHRIAIMKGHERRVTSCQATRDGWHIISTSWDGTIKLWDGRTGKFDATLSSLPCPINGITLHPEDKFAAVACWDCTIKVYDIHNRSRVAVLRGHESSVRAIAYSDTGKYISSASLDGQVKLWSAINGSMVGQFEGHSLPVTCLMFVPEEELLVTASKDSRLKLWSSNLGRMLACWPAASEYNSVKCMALSSSQACFVAGYSDGTVTLHNLTEQDAIDFELGLSNKTPINGICWNSDETRILVCSDGGCVLEINGRTREHAIIYQQDDIKWLSIAASSVWITAVTNNKSEILLLNSAREKIYLSGAHSGHVTCCAFNHSGSRLASAGHDMNLVVWDVTDAVKCSCLSDARITPLLVVPHSHLDWINSLSWSDASDYLVTASNDCTIKLWDFSKKELKSEAKLTLTGHMASVVSVAYKIGCIVSVSTDGVMKLWSQKGTEITSVSAHNCAITCCSLTIRAMASSTAEDSETISDWSQYMEYQEAAGKSKVKAVTQLGKCLIAATGSADGSIKIWNPTQANELTEYTNTAGAVSVSSHREVVACSYKDKSVKLWSTTIREPVKRLSPCYQPISAMDLKDFWLVTGSRDGTVSLWNLSSTVPFCCHTLTASSKAVSSLVFLSGNRVAAGTEDCQIIVYVIRESSGACLHQISTSKTAAPITTMFCLGNAEGKDCIVYSEWNGNVMVHDVPDVVPPAGTNKNYTHKAASRQTPDRHRFSLPETWIQIVCGNILGGSDGQLTIMGESSDENQTVVLNDLGFPISSPVWLQSAVAIGPDEYWIGDSDGCITVLRNGTPALKKAIHSGGVSTMAVCRQRVFTGSYDAMVKIWTFNCELLFRFACPAPVTKLTVREDKEEGNKFDILIGDKLGNLHKLDYYPC